MAAYVAVREERLALALAHIDYWASDYDLSAFSATQVTVPPDYTPHSKKESYG